MCGITGYSGNGDKEILSKMNDSLIHRGPDDYGLHISGQVGLAQRRLSIIDLSPGGHQPMSNEDGTVWIVFNGEIYNFQELKSELKNKHNFKGGSDTEVIIHLYEEIGKEVFSKIHGMFAIAIYDTKKNELVLARDRMGKKPLYWHRKGNTFIFGSELKALMMHPEFKKEINLNALPKYFFFENIPTPLTIFENTFKLEPGHYLVWNGKDIKKKTFWKPDFLPKAHSFDQSLKDLDTALSKAVNERLVSDVPLGIFLSGGLDSSTVAYYASKASTQKVKTFSIGFKEKSFDESDYARQVAKHLGTDHYEKIFSINECLELIPKISEMLDEPLADASIIPTYLLSKFTKEHVTVALGGDGGDELFAGYDTFLAHRLAYIYCKFPNFVNKIVAKSAHFLPTKYSNMSLDFRLKRFTGGMNEKDIIHRDRVWFSSFAEPSLLFSKKVRQKLKYDLYQEINNDLKDIDSTNDYDKLTLMYERAYMMDEVLVKVDRASMMNSLEVRAPFLSTSVVDLANHLPIDFKMKWFTRKYILKELMKDKLPKDIVYRPKKGFGIPLGQWFRGEMRPLVLDLLSKKSLDKIGLFDTDFVSRIVDDHLSGRCDNRKQIWSLLVFVMWWNRWMK